VYALSHYHIICIYIQVASYAYYMISQRQAQELMSSIRISHKAKSRLAKIGARLTLKDGNTRSMEEIIDLLVEYWEKEHKGEA
jgi:hypothetical protein